MSMKSFKMDCVRDGNITLQIQDITFVYDKNHILVNAMALFHSLF